MRDRLDEQRLRNEILEKQMQLLLNIRHGECGEDKNQSQSEDAETVRRRRLRAAEHWSGGFFCLLLLLSLLLCHSHWKQGNYS